MEEIINLRECLESGRYSEALLIAEEIEEMSKEDKLNKIYSFSVILLLHLIKQHVEKQTTKSWDFSIYNSIQQITRINRRRKAKGNYAKHEELSEILEEAFPVALKGATLEAFEGKFDENELLSKMNKKTLLEEALHLISPPEGNA